MEIFTREYGYHGSKQAWRAARKSMHGGRNDVSEKSWYDLKMIVLSSCVMCIAPSLLNWSQHKGNPSSSAMFRDIKNVSVCEINNIFEIGMKAVRDTNFSDEIECNVWQHYSQKDSFSTNRALDIGKILEPKHQQCHDRKNNCYSSR